MKIISRILIIIGLALIAIGRKLDKPEPPAAKCVIILPRRQYRHAPPSRFEVFRLGFSVLFSSARFGLIGV